MRRRVAHIVNQYLPVSENWIYNQIKALPSLDSIVITPRDVINEEVFPLPEIYSFAARPAWVRGYNRLRRKLSGSSVFPYYTRVCQQRDVGILHAHFGFVGAYFLEMKHRLGVPLVTTFYGYDLREILTSEPILNDLYPRLFAQGDHFLVEGPAMKDTLEQIGCPRSKITVQRLGVNRQLIPRADAVGAQDGVIRVLMAASFREKKGHEFAIRAFAKICEAHSTVQLDLIGGGPLEGQLRDLVSELGIESRVVFHGFKGRNELNEFIRQTQIFLHPSLETRDGDTEGGSPVIIAEVTAAGIPVVSTFHADIPEIVLHEETGLLAPEKDVDVLAEHLDSLISSPERRLSFGARGIEHVAAKFDLARQGELLEQVYLDLGNP